MDANNLSRIPSYTDNLTGSIQPEVAALVRRHLAGTGRHLGQDGPLFRAHDRAAAARLTKAPGRLTARAVGLLVARCARRARIDAKRVSPHALRYTDHLALAELQASVPHLPIAAAADRGGMNAALP